MVASITLFPSMNLKNAKRAVNFWNPPLCMATITAQAASGLSSAWPREKTFYLRLTGKAPVRYVLNLKEQWAFSFCRPQLTLSKHDCTNAAPTAEATITRRLMGAGAEIAHAPEFEFVIINDSFDVALSQLISVVTASRLNFQNQAARHREQFISLGVPV